MTIVPLYSESANYQEWECTEDATAYTIVLDAGNWTLLQKHGETWLEIGGTSAVWAFLQRHGLMLAP